MRPAQSARRDAFLQKVGGRPVIMGILNVTPDSFSDGGAFTNADLAIAHAKQMVADGCDIVDLGGESTRPGATPLGTADELARVEPILAMLEGDLDAPVSIDTYKANVAAHAIEHGAIVVNDVWGLQKDPAMAEVVASAEAAVVIMHNRTEKDPSLDILADIRRFFDRSLTLADNAGIRRERIILDPGIGFAKTSHQNRDVVARLGELRNYALPILVGASRKTFLGGLGDGSEGSIFGTIAVNLAAAANGASIFRVHDVAPNRAALSVFYSVRADTARVLRAP
jgi:dihydropteroate synthase